MMVVLVVMAACRSIEEERRGKERKGKERREKERGGEERKREVGVTYTELIR